MGMKTNPCRICLGPLTPHGARGLCHACYERERYRKTPEKIRARNRASYHKHREKRLVEGRRWREKNPGKVRENNRQYRLKNKAKLDAYFSEWKKKNPRKIRDMHLRRMYGISLEEYESLLASQGGACAVCECKVGTKNKSNLCVDHHHGTGRVRGLLCSQCNQAIGLMAESAERLRKAADYLSSVVC